MFVCFPNCAYLISKDCFLTFFKKVQAGLVDWMTATVLHQSYMTQYPSLFTLTSHYTIIFSLDRMFTDVGLRSARRFFVWLLLISWVIWNKKHCHYLPLCYAFKTNAMSLSTLIDVLQRYWYCRVSHAKIAPMMYANLTWKFFCLADRFMKALLYFSSFMFDTYSRNKE